MSIKSVLHDILPAPLLAYASAVEQQIKLAAIAPSDFLSDTLRPSNDFLLDIILEDEDAAHSWAEDSAEIARVHAAQDALGHTNAGERRALYTLVRALKPASVLEIGTHIGSSTIHIARALKSNGGGHITTVDIYDVNHNADGSWKKFGLPVSVEQMLQQAMLDDRVTFRTDTSLNFLKTTDLNFDMIFLDGDNTAVAVYNEVSAALKKLSPDGVIILHDYYPDGKALFPNAEPIYGPYLGMRRVMSENPQVKVVPLGELPWPTRDGVNATSLAVILKA